MNVSRRWCPGRLAIPLALMLLVSACAHRPELDHVSHLPTQVQIQDVPFFAQDVNQCGAAALATVLQFRGQNISPQQLQPSLYIPEKEGSLAIELGAQARRFGLLSYPLNSDLHAILSELAAGNPVLVFQNLGLTWWPQFHFAVVVGYDLNNSTLTLRSGRERERQTAFRTFLNTWQRAGSWARVIIPSDQIPATAEPIPFLQAVAALEQTGQSDAAQRGYRSSQQHWPDKRDSQILASIGLANIAYQQARYDEAENELLDAIKQAPDSAAAWNNLAYVLLAKQCVAVARTAISCALALKPDDPNLLDSHTDIHRHTIQLPPAQAACPNLHCPQQAD